ncbi:MAG: agmatinase [Candidatus Bathyarchaeia archaeon]
MSYLQLYASPSRTFSGFQTEFSKARYAVLGVPFDGTSTYRADSRFAPQAVRDASLNVETYSFRSGLDVEGLPICDCGDLTVQVDVDETLRRIERATQELHLGQKIPVLLGGEHTITLGAIRALSPSVGVVDFDAHMDLRDEYMGARLSHATVMRRVAESLGPSRLVQVGIRAACKEELQFAEQNGLTYLTARRLQTEGATALAALRRVMEPWEEVYVSIDMDVLDPAYAPGVGNPEPEGLSTTVLLDILAEACDGRVKAIDLTEVAPHYDMGQTAVQAARILFEALCYVESSLDRQG